MKSFHVICGLPRSGSTLLCNVLAQNPDFRVIHTSPLPGLLQNLGGAITNVPEIKGLLQKSERQTDEMTFRQARSLVESTYDEDVICIDKNRLWNVHQFLLEKLYPKARMVVMVRDLRSVFASIERNWRRNPLMHIPPGMTIRQRFNNSFDANDGIIGSAMMGIEDLSVTKTERALFIKYEDLAKDPRLQLQNIYNHLGLPIYKHDFEKIKNTAVDPDLLYLNKFPHRGDGKVQAKDLNAWMSLSGMGQFGQEIAQTYHIYQQKFGYQ